MLQPVAPTGDVTSYDQHHLALYAALVDAGATGMHWCDAATQLMNLNPADEGAEQCWRSHLERARWIIGDGLGPAIEAFGRSAD